MRHRQRTNMHSDARNLVGLVICVVALLAFAPASLAQDSGGGGDARDVVLAQIMAQVDAARALRVAGEPGWGEMLRRAAAELNAAGFGQEAVDVLGELIDRPETWLDQASGLRQQGQYLRDLGEVDAALRAFDAMIALYESKPSLQTVYSIDYLSGLSSRSEIRMARGDLLAAEDDVRKIRELEVFDQLPQLSKASFFRRTARVLGKIGRHAEAADALRRILTEAPDTVTDPDELLELRLEILRTEHPRQRSDAYLDALVAMWEGDALWDHPRVLDVGYEVADTHLRRGDLEGMVLAAYRVVRAAEARRDAWLAVAADGEDRASLDERIKMRRVLSLGKIHSAARRVGREDLLVFALTRQVQLEDNPRNRQNIQEQLDYARARMERTGPGGEQ